MIVAVITVFLLSKRSNQKKQSKETIMMMKIMRFLWPLSSGKVALVKKVSFRLSAKGKTTIIVDFVPSNSAESDEMIRNEARELLSLKQVAEFRADQVEMRSIIYD